MPIVFFSPFPMAVSGQKAGYSVSNEQKEEHHQSGSIGSG